MATQKAVELDVLKVDHGKIEFMVLGTTPLILNRMSEKVLRELLLPRNGTAGKQRRLTWKCSSCLES